MINVTKESIHILDENGILQSEIAVKTVMHSKMSPYDECAPDHLFGDVKQITEQIVTKLTNFPKKIPAWTENDL